MGVTDWLPVLSGSSFDLYLRRLDAVAGELHARWGATEWAGGQSRCARVQCTRPWGEHDNRRTTLAEARLGCKPPRRARKRTCNLPYPRAAGVQARPHRAGGALCGRLDRTHPAGQRAVPRCAGLAATSLAGRHAWHAAMSCARARRNLPCFQACTWPSPPLPMPPHLPSCRRALRAQRVGAHAAHAGHPTPVGGGPPTGQTHRAAVGPSSRPRRSSGAVVCTPQQPAVCQLLLPRRGQPGRCACRHRLRQRHQRAATVGGRQQYQQRRLQH